MSEYERGFTDALKIVLIKIENAKNIKDLEEEVRRILHEAEKTRLRSLMRLIN